MLIHPVGRSLRQRHETRMWRRKIYCPSASRLRTHALVLVTAGLRLFDSQPAAAAAQLGNEYATSSPRRRFISACPVGWRRQRGITNRMGERQSRRQQPVSGLRSGLAPVLALPPHATGIHCARSCPPVGRSVRQESAHVVIAHNSRCYARPSINCHSRHS